MKSKRLLLLASFLIAMATTIHAQGPDSTGGKQVSPQTRATHQLKVLQKQLNLTRDQVMQARIILLNQAISLDSLKTNASGNKKLDGRSRRAIVLGADQQISALLTDDQKKLYDQWKQTRKEEQIEKKNIKTSTPQ